LVCLLFLSLPPSLPPSLSLSLSLSLIVHTDTHHKLTHFTHPPTRIIQAPDAELAHTDSPAAGSGKVATLQTHTHTHASQLESDRPLLQHVKVFFLNLIITAQLEDS
jgi:hypothetical protein